MKKECMLRGVGAHIKVDKTNVFIVMGLLISSIMFGTPVGYLIQWHVH